jgi:carboxymethylenebutenolidase
MARNRWILCCLVIPTLILSPFNLSATESTYGVSVAGRLIAPEIVTFLNGKVVLKGLFYRPAGTEPFSAVLYNHGGARGMLSQQAVEHVAPMYLERGWAFFVPYRRGQGLSESVGSYIMDEIDKVGKDERSKKFVNLLTQDHLSDQMAALSWLKSQKSVNVNKIVIQGNSLGGIQTVLAAEREKLCAAVDASGAADAWADSPELRERMTQAVQNSQAPIFFFQAENDFDTSPSRILSAAMKKAGKVSEMKIYPAYGSTPKDGHAFAYLGSKLWADNVFKFLHQHCN